MTDKEAEEVSKKLNIIFAIISKQFLTKYVDMDITMVSRMSVGNGKQTAISVATSARDMSDLIRDLTKSVENKVPFKSTPDGILKNAKIIEYEDSPVGKTQLYDA